MVWDPEVSNSTGVSTWDTETPVKLLDERKERIIPYDSQGSQWMISATEVLCDDLSDEPESYCQDTDDDLSERHCVDSAQKTCYRLYWD